jgi:hypothetical protein
VAYGGDGAVPAHKPGIRNSLLKAYKLSVAQHRQGHMKELWRERGLGR